MHGHLLLQPHSERVSPPDLCSKGPCASPEPDIPALGVDELRTSPLATGLPRDISVHTARATAPRARMLHCVSDFCFEHEEGAFFKFVGKGLYGLAVVLSY